MLGKLALVLVLPLGSFRSDASPVGPCDHLWSAAPVQIDAIRIGPFPLTASLDSLRRLCPGARPTLGHGFEAIWAALDLSVGEVSILAGQNWRLKPAFDAPAVPDPVVEWSRSPSHWVVSGCGALLPGGVSSCGTWADLVTAFGVVGTGSTEFGPLTVDLAALPGIAFQFDVTDEVVGSIDEHGDLSRIPPTARIVEITVVAS